MDKYNDLIGKEPSNAEAKRWLNENFQRLVNEYGRYKGERIAYITAWKLNESSSFVFSDQEFEEALTQFAEEFELAVDGSNFERLEETLVEFIEDDDEDEEYDDHDFDDDEDEDELNEALNREQRRKRGLVLKRNKAKLARGRKLSQKRRASSDKIQKRARKQARQMIMKKLVRGRNLNELSPAEKQKLEARVDKMKGLVSRLAKKLIMTIRKKEQDKLSNKPKDKE